MKDIHTIKKPNKNIFKYRVIHLVDKHNILVKGCVHTDTDTYASAKCWMISILTDTISSDTCILNLDIQNSGSIKAGRRILVQAINTANMLYG